MPSREWSRQTQPKLRSASDHRHHPSAPNEALDRWLIAELDAVTINQMTDEELARVIEVANLPQLLNQEQSFVLPRGNREAILRLAHLARYCCRNQSH